MTFPPVTPEYTQRLQAKGYNHQQIETAWNYAHACHELHNATNGQVILDYCHQHGYAPKTTFTKWHDGYVLGKDDKNRRILVIGSFLNGKFVLRGTIRAKSHFKSMGFFCNGQASTNSIQLAHIAEQDNVPFPEFEQLQKEANALYN